MRAITKGAVIRIAVVVALAGGWFLYTLYQKNAPVLTGTVSHFGSDAPFAGSTVVLTCESREIVTTSAKDGEFSFSAEELRPCIVYATLEAKAAGYQDSQRVGAGLENFMPYEVKRQKEPHRLKLVGESEVSQVKLDALRDRAFAPPQTDRAKTAIGAYSRLVDSLAKSVKIAATAKEKQWLREQYCDRLKSAWAALDPDQQGNTLLVRYYPEDFAEVCR